MEDVCEINIGKMFLSSRDKYHVVWLYNAKGEGIGLTEENEAELEQLLQEFFEKHF